MVGLGEGRAVVLDRMLGGDVWAQVRAQALRRWQAGALRRAGVGRDKLIDPAVRGDCIAWVEPDDEGFAAVLELFAGVMTVLDEMAWLGARTIEAQVAVYPVGAGYQRHRDNVVGGSRRRMTLIYYANDWRPGDGGELEILEADGPRLIEPCADRLVLFRPHLEHAVRPALREPRVAISGWLNADLG